MTDLLLLPGDGIGPEVTAQVRRVAGKIAPDLTLDERPFGGASFDQFGSPLTDETLAAAKAAKAVLMGAVGGPKWKDAPRDKRPEAGLLSLRAGMGVFANLRPALCFQPPGGGRRAVDTQVYTTMEIERIARVAFELARGRRNKVSSAEKSNVMETGLLWREVVTDLHRREYSDVELEHILADNAAMQIVKYPKQFDVMVTDNLFGDILSDAAAQLTGSLGMLPSAALGMPGTPGLYEPIHGSAPDIAGKGIANPLAAILSFEMALRWSLDSADLADKLFAAVSRALEKGARTPDLGGTMTTVQMADAVLAEL